MQQLHFEHLTIDDGLPDASVFSIFQDHLGFLWLGTGNGLVRYDGYSLKVFEPDPDDPTSIGSGAIEDIVEDDLGNLWVSSLRGGLSRFDRTTEQFTRFGHNPNNPNSLTSNRVTRVTWDGERYLWAQTQNSGLNRIDPVTGRITRYRHDRSDPGSIADDLVRVMIIDRMGRIWVGTPRGLDRFDAESETFVHYRHNPEDPAGIVDDDVRALVEEEGTLWIGTGAGLDRFDPASEEFVHYRHRRDKPSSLSHDTVHSLFVGRDRTLWVGTENGLDRFDSETGDFTHFLPLPNAPQAASNRILGIYEDRTDLLWVQTPDQSSDSENLYTFDTEIRVFTPQVEDPDTPSSIAIHKGVKAMFEDRTGTMWIGAWMGGLNKLDRSRLRFQHDPSPAGVEKSHDVRAIYEDSQRRLWIATGTLRPRPHDVGLRIIDPEAGTFVDYRLGSDDRERPNMNVVLGVHEDHAGRLWLLTAQGLRQFHPATGVGNLYVPYENPEDPRDNLVLSVFEDQGGFFWVGTRTGGLLQFDPTTGAFLRSYRYDADSLDSIPSSRINDIHGHGEGKLWLATGAGLVDFDLEAERFTVVEDSVVGRFNARMIYQDRRGLLWLATWPRGLVRFDTNTGVFAAFSTFGDVLNNSVRAVLEDNKGDLWISSDRGLWQFDPRQEVFRPVPFKDGLVENHFNVRAAFRTSTGRLYFGGEHGLTSFSPDGVRENPNPPLVVLTGLRLFNEPVRPSADGPLQAPMTDIDTVRLNHDQNDVTFEYVAIHFSRSEENQYAYMLDGYEHEWRYVGTQRTAIYPDLPPGDYTFRVKAANYDGVWNEAGASIRLIVVPPWWEQSWFYGLSALGLLALILGGAMVRVRGLRMEARAPSGEVDDHPREPVADSEEVRVQNRRLVELQAAGARTMRRQANRSFGMVSRAPKVSDLQPDGTELDRRPGDLTSFLRELVRSFSPLAERRRITLRFRPEEDVHPLVFDHEVLSEVVSNLLSNALKFTPEDGGVWVTTASDDEAVEVIVKDTGPGIPPETKEHIFDRFYQVDDAMKREYEGTGLGLALARELVELHVGTLRVKSEIGVGSAFIVRLPLEIPFEALEPQSAELGNGFAAPDQAVEPDVGGYYDDAVSESGQRRRTVLVVDDNRDLRVLLRDALEKHYRVLEATNGAEGLEAVLAYEPDLVVSDTMMLHMNGFELCEAMKSTGGPADIPLIFLTTDAAALHRVQGREVGADGFLTKPFSRAEAQICITNMMLSNERAEARTGWDGLVTPTRLGKITLEDETLLRHALKVMERYLGQGSFSVDAFAAQLGLPRRMAQRRLKAITGHTLTDLLRRMQVRRAKQLLEIHPGAVSEVARALGFKSPSRFFKAYRKVFGAAPARKLLEKV